MNARRVPAWAVLALAVATAVDGGVVVSLLATDLDAGGVSRLLVAHVALGFAQAALLAVAVGPPELGQVCGLAAAACVLAVFIPVVGAAGLYAALRFSSRVGGGRPDEPWLRLRVDLERRRPRATREPSASAIAAVLANQEAGHADRRFAALLRTAHLPPRAVGQLLEMALRDPSDEVRLFAFSRMERMRSELEQAIRSFHALLLTAADTPTRQHLHLRLAETHWEFAYLGLAEGAVLDHALESALLHATESERLARGSAPASFLRGRILLHRRDTSGADAALKGAVRLGYSATKVLPYLAECAFRARAFGQVRQHLRSLERISHGYAPLARAREFWR